MHPAVTIAVGPLRSCDNPDLAQRPAGWRRPTGRTTRQTIYAPNFFATLGQTGQSEKLFATCILGVVKLTSAYLSAFFLIEFIGRRRSLYSGIMLQMLALLYIAIFLGVVGEETLDSGDLYPTQSRAATGAIAMLYVSGVGWTMGWNSFQYLVNAEIWPLRLRALGSSLVMCFHFINQFGNTKAVPLMLLAMSSSGFFAFCAVVCFLGLLWVWFFVPELAGRSLESTDELFNLPLVQDWPSGRQACAGFRGSP
ncbi:sugar porter family MFS transporter [Microdochium nivale]|nr:sugar porter family MFS transporter [Microdochium nivale]